MEIVADRLLLVEGRDEVNLFDALMQHCLGEEGRLQVQIVEVGGRDRFRKNLSAVAVAARTRPALHAIGVVRDADDDAGGAFRSVRDGLRHAGYQPPPAHGEFSDAEPTVGVFIVPDGSRSGAIETLCMRSRAGDAVSGCVDEYMKCLAQRGAMRSRNPDKTFAHAYLAAADDPVARVGEGARQGAWDFDSEAFYELCGFLRRLFEAAPRADTINP